MKNNIDNESPLESVKEETSYKVKKNISDSVQKQASKIFFTDKENKIDRATKKLEKKEDKVLKQSNDNSLTNLDSINKIFSGGENLKNNNVKNNYHLVQSPKKIDVNNSNHNSSNVILENSINKNLNEKRIIKEENRALKLNKQIDNLELKKEKNNDDKVKLSRQKEALRDKHQENTKKLLDKKKTPFSSKDIGKRTTGAKVLTAPVGVSNKFRQSYKRKVINKDIQESDDQGLKFANDVISTSGGALKKQTVNTFNTKIGFDRKANNLLKLEKKELKVRKKELKSDKKQIKINRKKLRLEKSRNKGSLGSRFENTKLAITSFIKSLGNGGTTLQNMFSSKLIMIAGASLVLLISMGIFILPIGIGLTGGLGTARDSSIIYEYGDIVLSIDLESKHYQSLNIYTKAGYRGQCTWFVWGRVHELYGANLPGSMGNGGDWIDNVKGDDRFIISSEPKTHSIMVLGGTKFGHVAFVESYDPDKEEMIVSEGNIGNPMGGTEQMIEYAEQHYSELFTLTNTMTGKEKSRYGMNIIGYIHLDNFVDMEVGE